MAKLSPRRRPRINNLRLQPSGVVAENLLMRRESGLNCGVIAARTADRPSAGFANRTLATASRTHSGCRVSKQWSFQPQSRLPKRQIPPSRMTAVRVGPGGPESGCSK
jgi:hypothetical protein